MYTVYERTAVYKKKENGRLNLIGSILLNFPLLKLQYFPSRSEERGLIEIVSTIGLLQSNLSIGKIFSSKSVTCPTV